MLLASAVRVLIQVLARALLSVLARAKLRNCGNVRIGRSDGREEELCGLLRSIGNLQRIYVRHHLLHV